jgi:hypothetical protein
MGIGFGETLPRMSEQLTDQVLVERVQKGDQTFGVSEHNKVPLRF